MGQGTFRAGLNSDPTYVSLSKEIVGTPGKELLVSEDYPQWWTKVIQGRSIQLVFMGFLGDPDSPVVAFNRRDWVYAGGTAPGGSMFGGLPNPTWSEVIDGGGIPTQGDPNRATNPGAKYFDTLTQYNTGSNFLQVPSSETHSSDAYGDTVTQSSGVDFSGFYNRAVSHRDNHNFNEFFWQDALLVGERSFSCDPFDDDTTGIDSPLSAASSIPPPWDRTDYNVGTVNGYTSDQPGNTGVCRQVLGGWGFSVPNSSFDAGMAGFTANKGEFKVDRAIYYAWVSQYTFAGGVPLDAANNYVHFISDGTAVPGTIYSSPGPITTPFPGISDSHAGPMTGENVILLIGETPETFAAAVGLLGVVGRP